jgi:proline iminopeptidase
VSLERQIEDLEELRISLGIDRMQLLGWSTYGMEMAVYALRYPDRVSRLVQVSPLAPAAEIMEQHEDKRAEKMDRAAIARLEARFEAGEFDDSPEQYCRQLSALTTPASFVNAEFAALVPDDCDYPNEWPMNRSAYFRAFFATLGDFDWRDDLQELEVPRLIIHGREDGIPLAGAEAWAYGYDNARLIVVSPSGHFPFVEQKETVLADIETFLAGDWPDNATGSAPR